MSSAISDRPNTWWNEVITQKKCSFMHDWESGIDCLDSVLSSFQKKIN